jgi:transposase
MTKKTKRNLNKKPKMLKLTPEQVTKYIDRLEARISDDDELLDFFSLAVHGNLWFSRELEQGTLTIAKLRRLFQIQGSEKSSNRNQRQQDKQRLKSSNTGHNSKTKGHGRNSADAYAGAEVVDVLHPELIPGDICPTEECGGKLYEMTEPGVVIRVTGSPLAKATRYNQQKLRCAICEAIYTAALPGGISSKKYDESFVSMLMINKYFMSVPLYRQDRLQQYLGMPLPCSTQWDLMHAYAPMLKKLYSALCLDAANGIGLCYDDTSVKILSEIKAKKKAAKGEKSKHNCFTTGIVSVHESHRAYVYMSDTSPAGQTIDALLKLRAKDAPPPMLMCDALSANTPTSISKDLYVLCYCLVHARRQFYELPNGYDDLADTVIRLIGNIYDNEVTAKTLDAKARLKYHKEKSQPIMAKLKTYLKSQHDQFEPNGVAGKAIAYILKRFTELTQFLRHANAPLDTNIVEQALKLVIQTRKSSLFYKSLSSAAFASYVQSALYSAAQNDINPCDYMTVLLQNEAAVIKDPDYWLPWSYKETLKQSLAVGARKLPSQQESPGSR